MPNRCVAANCGNYPDLDRGIVLHVIPFYGNENPIAKKRRRQWIEFVKAKRAHFEPTPTSRICSGHFKPEDYIRRYHKVEGQENPSMPRHIRDDIGVVPIPTIQATPTNERGGDDVNTAVTSGQKRRHRQLVKDAVKELDAGERERDLDVAKEDELDHDADHNADDEWLPVATKGNVLTECPDKELLDDTALSKEISTQMHECSGCACLKETNRMLKNRIISLRASLNIQRNNAKAIIISRKRKLGKKVQHVEDLGVPKPVCGSEDEDLDFDHDDETDDGDCYEPEEDMEEDLDSDTEEELEFDNHNLQTGAGDRDEPKHIVFLSQLLLLFRICFICKADNPLIATRQTGSMIEVRATCSSSSCGFENVWSSQPRWKDTKIPSGNLLLSMATLFSGSSITKVKNVFKHMGLGCVSFSTFFKIQRTKLFPAILLFWKQYQKSLIKEIKDRNSKIIISGDGRHDSMGHSAKYGTYSMFSNTTAAIVHFEMVQKNEAGSSSGMEFMGFQRCMKYLQESSVVIDTFISDRHTSIAKSMKEQHSDIIHYYDLWHLTKKLRKLMLKLGKKKHCEVLNSWIKSCVNHLYWSVTTTSSGNGRLIWAKFSVFLSHILNKHQDLENPLFNKCIHGPITTQRKFLAEDSTAYEQFHKALTNTRLVNAIKKASPLDQTSCLEGFHSVVNHFAPKMFAYSHTGMICRYILACTHFNFNLQREEEFRKDGVKKIKVVWPKFLSGDAKIRDVKVKQNFDYVEEIYQMLKKATNEELAQEAKSSEERVPAPIHTMLERQSRNDAIAKWQARKAMVPTDVPATGIEEGSLQQRKKAGNKKPRAAPTCRKCKMPTKGHICPFK